MHAGDLELMTLIALLLPLNKKANALPEPRKNNAKSYRQPTLLTR